MTTPVPTQLNSVYEELAAQEEAIAAELATIQEQLMAIRQVISLFSDSAPPPVEKTTQPTKLRSSAKAKRTSKAKATKPSATQSKAKGKSAASKRPSQKKDGRAASWQKYALPGVKKQPMPEAVRLILATQPDKDFKIVEVMSALFKENMPKSQYLKARNRISNILSGGVRSGDWHKGARGAYRLHASS